MIILYTDRTIRVFNWFANNQNATSTNQSQDNNHNTNNPFQESGKFVIEQSWELPDQICSMHIVKDFINNKDLIATQPGGKAIFCKSQQITVNSAKTELSNSSSTSSLSDLTANNPSVSTKTNSFITSYEEVLGIKQK